jgi:hypothetical protein
LATGGRSERFWKYASTVRRAKLSGISKAPEA